MTTHLLLLLLIVVTFDFKAGLWRKRQTKSIDHGWFFAILGAWATLSYFTPSGASGLISKGRSRPRNASLAVSAMAWRPSTA